MELKDYTIEELKNELKRRAAVAKEEKKNELRCRNCIHIVKDERYGNMYHCDGYPEGVGKDLKEYLKEKNIGGYMKSQTN